MGMRPIVPLVSSLAPGQLGVAHLPRLWLKASLKAVDLLPAGYRSGNEGIDAMVLAGIGLDPGETVAFLGTLPSYLAFERWVREHATRIDAASVAASNAAVVAQSKPAEGAAAVRASVGLTESDEAHSVLLNDLDDWQTVYADVVSRGGAGDAIVPAITSGTAGPLGVVHLPRFWLKATLKANGALPAGYNSGPGGFDGFALENIGIDMAAALALIETERPDYVAFERWAAAHGTRCDPAGIARHNAAAFAREKPLDKAAEDRAELGTTDMTLKHNVLLNALVDWKLLHDIFLARRAAVSR